jgi:ATP-dependent 26S proteasome regulatory subunit
MGFEKTTEVIVNEFRVAHLKQRSIIFIDNFDAIANEFDNPIKLVLFAEMKKFALRRNVCVIVATKL